MKTISKRKSARMKKHFCEEDGGKSLQGEGAYRKDGRETSKREFQDTEEMEEHQSGRSEKSVAKVVQKTMKKRQWRSRKWRRGREPHTKEDVIHWNGDLANVSNNINLGSGVKTVGRDLFLVSGNTICSKGKACMRLKTEEEMKQQQRMKTMSDRTRKIKEKDRNGREHSWWVSELLAADC